MAETENITTREALSRRRVLTGAASVAVAAASMACALPAYAMAPDPVLAAIEKMRPVKAAHEAALAEYSRLEMAFFDEWGHMPRVLIGTELATVRDGEHREGWTARELSIYADKDRSIDTFFDCARREARDDFAGAELEAKLRTIAERRAKGHAEFDAQLAQKEAERKARGIHAIEEQVGVLGNQFHEALEAVYRIVPTTPAGILALLELLRDEDDFDTYAPDALDSIIASAKVILGALS